MTHPGKAATAARPRRRRSFSQQNLAVTHEGPDGALLAEALQVPPEGGYEGTHAFHPYPGRFHPRLPRLVLQAFARPGEGVLDPFMGGGTTLVEARLLGLAAVGNDLNPVAHLVATERTRPRTRREADAVTSEARRLAGAVEALRREKRPPRLYHPRLARLTSHYERHLFAEMAQWYRLLGTLHAGPVRDTLRAVFSAGVVKFSNRAADSDARSEPVHYPKGAVSRFLVRKAEELVRAQVAYGRALPPDAPPVRLYAEDARLLPSLGWGEAAHVVTSPPYPGTYAYQEQHALRMDWLELDAGPFNAGEIGTPGDEGGWSEALRDVLGTLARVLKPGGDLVLVMGDWIGDGHAVDAAAMLERTAAARDWRLVSRASVQRGAFSRPERKAFARRGKWEHVLRFTRPGAA